MKRIIPPYICTLLLAGLTGLPLLGQSLSVSPNPVVAGQPISVSLSLPSGCVENNWSIYFNGSRIGGGSGSSSISASYGTFEFQP